MHLHTEQTPGPGSGNGSDGWFSTSHRDGVLRPPGAHSGVAHPEHRLCESCRGGPGAPSSPSLRTVVDPGGQMINATDMLPVMAGIPTMTVWGGRDRLIPKLAERNARMARLVATARPAGASGHPGQPAGDLPQGGPLPAPGGAAPVRRPAGGLRRANRGPAGADRGAARDRQAGPRLGGDVSARTSGIDASAWTAPTRRASATGRRRPTDTAPGSASAAGPDRTASELGYALGAGVRGAFGGDPTRCRGLPMSFWSGYWYWRLGSDRRSRR